MAISSPSMSSTRSRGFKMPVSPMRRNSLTVIGRRATLGSRASVAVSPSNSALLRGTRYIARLPKRDQRTLPPDLNSETMAGALSPQMLQQQDRPGHLTALFLQHLGPAYRIDSDRRQQLAQ